MPAKENPGVNCFSFDHPKTHLGVVSTSCNRDWEMFLHDPALGLVCVLENLKEISVRDRNSLYWE
jgi:hypothetical protein